MLENRFTTQIRNQTKSENISIVLLASILKPGTKSIGPVSLLPVSSYESVIDMQYRVLSSYFPKSEIILVTGYESKKICNKKPKRVKVIENVFYEDRGNAEELRLALNIINNENIIVINGEMIFDVKTLSDLLGHNSCILVDKANNKDCLGTSCKSGKLEILSYGHPYIWKNIAFFKNKEIEVIQKFVSNSNKNKYGFHEIINHIVDNNGTINIVETCGNIFSIEEYNANTMQST